MAATPTASQNNMTPMTTSSGEAEKAGIDYERSAARLHAASIVRQRSHSIRFRARLHARQMKKGRQKPPLVFSRVRYGRRSEERRVGKECRSRGAAYHAENN